MSASPSFSVVFMALLPVDDLMLFPISYGVQTYSSTGFLHCLEPPRPRNGLPPCLMIMTISSILVRIILYIFLLSAFLIDLTITHELHISSSIVFRKCTPRLSYCPFYVVNCS